jgi:hypothetical protein
MKNKILFMIIIILISGIMGCSSKSLNPISDQTSDPSANVTLNLQQYSGLKVLGLITAEYNPSTRQGSCIVKSGRELSQYSGVETYYNEETELNEHVNVEATFVELDNNSYFMHGEPLSDEQLAYQISHPHESDCVFLKVHIGNEYEDVPQTIISCPIIVLQGSSFHLWNNYDDPGDFDFTSSFMINGSGFISQVAGEHPDYCWLPDPIFENCYYPYKRFFINEHINQTPGLTDFQLAQGDVDDEIVMVTIDNDQYEPVYWNMVVVGIEQPIPAGQGEPPLPLAINTPSEDPTMHVDIDTDGITTFKVRIVYQPGVVISQLSDLTDNLEVVIDLGPLGVPAINRYQNLLPQDLAHNDVWEYSVDLINDLGMPVPAYDNYNPVLLPIHCRQKNQGGLLNPDIDDMFLPNQADLYMYAWQHPESHYQGYHMVSYIADDPNTELGQLFVQNTYTDQRWNISAVQGETTETHQGIDFHTISKDGSLVTWGSHSDSHWGIYIAHMDHQNELVTAIETEDIITDTNIPAIANLPWQAQIFFVSSPVISADGTRLVMQVDYTYLNANHTGILAAIIDPDDLQAIDLTMFWSGNVINSIWGMEPLTMYVPWVSDHFMYNSYIGVIPPGYPQPREGHMISFCFTKVYGAQFPDNFRNYIGVMILTMDSSNQHLTLDIGPISIPPPQINYLSRYIGYESNGSNTTEYDALGNITHHPGYVRCFTRSSIVMTPQGSGSPVPKGYLTYQALTQGNYEAYRIPVVFNDDADYFYLGEENPSGEYIVKLGEYWNEDLSHNFLPLTILQDPEVDDGEEGVISIVRDGQGKDAEIWLNSDQIVTPFGTMPFMHNCPIRDFLNIENGMADIPAVSQDLFNFVPEGDDKPVYPAFAFDSEMFSTGDIGYIRWIGFWNEDYGQPKFIAKRLTYDGTARFPRLSGLIIPEE